eukprot:g18001.t1
MGAFGALDSLKEGATKKKARQTYSSLGGEEFRASRRLEDGENPNYQLLNPTFRAGMDKKTEAILKKKGGKALLEEALETNRFAAEPRVPLPRAEPVGRLRVKDETPWRQYQHGSQISSSTLSMPGYATKKRFAPSDIKGTEFDKVSLPSTRDGPVGSLSARDLIDPAAARGGNSKPDTEADSDSFEEKNHLTCTEDACLKCFEAVLQRAPATKNDATDNDRGRDPGVPNDQHRKVNTGGDAPPTPQPAPGCGQQLQENRARTRTIRRQLYTTRMARRQRKLRAPSASDQRLARGSAETQEQPGDAGGGIHPRVWWTRCAKSSITVATYNVRTLGRSGREGWSLELLALIRDANERAVGILLVQECRIEEWMIGLKVENFRLYGGGATRNKAGARVHGVLILAREDIQIEDVSCRESSRIVRVTTPGAIGRRVHFIAAYAPTDAAPTAEKRKFYKQLQEEVDNARGHDEIIVGGDMNAEAGEVQHELIEAGLPYSVGRCGMTPGFAIRSENSRLFADFLAENQLLTVSSIFQKGWASRWTFQGAFEGGRRRREYDHLLVRHRDRGQAKAFEVARDTHVESDHRMVTMQWAGASIQKKKKRNLAHKRRERTAAFAEEMDAHYRETWTEQELGEFVDTATAAELWQEFETKTEKILEGIKAEADERTRRKQWIGDTTRKLIEERRKQNKHGQATTKQRNAMKRKIAKAVRQDRAKWVEEKVQEIRRADAAGNTKAIYDAVRQIAGRARKPPQDLPGAPKVREDFWRGVLGQERPEAPAEMQEAASWRRCQQNLGEEPSPEERWSKTLTGTPTAEEVAAAVQGLKRGKSYAGLLPAEFFCGSKLANRILYEVVKKIFEGDDIPPGWLKAAITLLHKGGKKADPGNYRPVALLTVGEKLIALVIFNRVKEDAYARIDKRQKGSVRGMSCRHAVF